MISKFITAFILVIILCQSQSFSQEKHWNYYGGVITGLDISFINDQRLDQDEIGSFYYFIGNFINIGLEAGVYNSKSSMAFQLKYGVNPNPEVERDNYNYNGDLDLLDVLNIGISYRRYIREPKIGENISFQSGFRFGAIYQHYWGNRIFDNDQDLFLKEKHSMGLFGGEIGFFLELGRELKTSKTLILKVEPIYFRKTNDGFAIGLAKTCVQLRL